MMIASYLVIKKVNHGKIFRSHHTSAARASLINPWTMITWLMAHIARFPLTYPRTILVVSALLTVLTAWFIPSLHISTDRNLLAGQNSEIFQRREELSALFGTSLVAVAVLESQKDREKLFEAADALAARLEKEPEVADVFYRADIRFFEQHAFMFLPLDKVENLPNAVSAAEPLLNKIAQSPSLYGLVETLGDAIEASSAAPDPSVQGEAERGLAIFGAIFDQIAMWFERPELRTLPIEEQLWDAGPALAANPASKGYLVESDDERPYLAVLFVQPANDSQSAQVVVPLTDAIRRTADEVLAGYPEIRAKVTGMPAIATDEFRLVARDSVVAALVSGLGVLLIFALAFRSVRVTIFLVLPLGIGLIWSSGITALLYGHLTMITAYFAAVLFGLGVAFTIHIVARFHESLRNGFDKESALRIAIIGAGPGVVAGGGTTALAFLAVAFSDFRGFAEMGVISGLGVTLILAANLTVLPAALFLWHPGVSLATRRRVKPGGGWRLGMGRLGTVAAVVAVLGTVAGAAVIPFITFDYAVESMLPQDAESVEGMHVLDARTAFSTTYSMTVADSLEEAESLRERFSKLSTVSRAEALSMFVPAEQKARIDVLRKLDPTLKEKLSAAQEAVKTSYEGAVQTTPEALEEALVSLGDVFEDAAFAAKQAGRPESETLQKIVHKIRKTERVVEERATPKRVAELEKWVLSGLDRGLAVMKAGFEDAGFGPDDLPEAIRRRYVSRDGSRYAVIVFPAGDIADIDFFERHVSELLSVSDKTTGHPVTHLAFTRMVHKGFRDAVLFSGLAVVLLVILDLRRPKDLAMAFLPIVMGAGWTALIMVLVGLELNYANLMALPILIGTGVDYGVHLAHRAKQEGSVACAVQTTGRAIALTGLTTLIGFGSLLLGNHWGVRSLGLLLVIGIFASLAIALGVLPRLFSQAAPDAPGTKAAS